MSLLLSIVTIIGLKCINIKNILGEVSSVLFPHLALYSNFPMMTTHFWSHLFCIIVKIEWRPDCQCQWTIQSVGQSVQECLILQVSFFQHLHYSLMVAKSILPVLVFFFNPPFHKEGEVQYSTAMPFSIVVAALPMIIQNHCAFFMNHSFLWYSISMCFLPTLPRTRDDGDDGTKNQRKPRRRFFLKMILYNLRIIQ